MSDWSDGFDWNLGDDWNMGPPMDWSNGAGDWTGGYDLPGGGDTGFDLGPGSSFDVGPGQIPSDVYQYLLQLGALGPGMSTSMPNGRGGGSGGGGGALSGLGKLLGLGQGGDMSGLLGLLGSIGGGLLNYNATNKASDQLQQGIKDSNKVITDTLSGNNALYEPWRQAGLTALDKFQNQAPSNLAAGFGPLAGNYNSLGSGKGIKLSKMAKGG